MTSKDFISNNFGIRSDRERQCSSVFADHDGNIYSYGYHYPLLFEVNGLKFVNTRGYSNTTSRHIHWAKQAERGAIEVELNSNDRLPLTLGTVSERLHGMYGALRGEMASTKRKDTAKYADMQRRLDAIELSIMTVQGAM